MTPSWQPSSVVAITLAGSETQSIDIGCATYDPDGRWIPHCFALSAYYDLSWSQ